MSLKHLGSDSEMPPLKENTLRIYSMVFCPYAQRTRLIAAARNIEYETVNVQLRNNVPKWYVKEVNPLGQVPYLQHEDGRNLGESLIISEYLDNAYPGDKLTPSDHYKNAQHKIIVERFSKVITGYYKTLRSTENGANELSEALESFEKSLTSDFVGGEKEAFVDYMIWPWFERLEFLKLERNLEFNETKFPKLTAYIERMKQLPAVRKCYIPTEIHANFYKTMFSSDNPEYDLGINLTD